MSSQLSVTVELVDNSWQVTAELVSGSTLPSAIFVYTNTGTEQLGEFFGTCSVTDLTRLSEFTGTAIPTFGHQYVRYPQAKIRVDVWDDVSLVVQALLTNVRSLSTAYFASASTTTIYDIQ